MNPAGTAQPLDAPVRQGRHAWLLGWALAVAVLCANFGADAYRQEFYDPDNAMWLVSVRDVLNGQDYWDGMQHRLNPPEGASMHWARWIAFSIAAPIAVLTPVMGATMAEVIVAFIWPAALLAAFMILAVRICAQLGASDGLRTEASYAGAIVAALAFPVMAKFSPGSFDHHTIGLIFAFAGILGLQAMRNFPRAGAMAGAALGATMATAAEGLPVAAMGLLVGGLLWLIKPESYRRGLAWLGCGFAVSSLLFFLIMVAPSRWAAPVCDAMSPTFLAFGLAGGAIALLLGIGVPASLQSTFARRLGVAVCLSAAALAGLWLLFPECAGGGYSAMSADMKTYWLAQIAETRTPLRLAADDLPLFLGMAGAPAAALVAAGFFLWRRWNEPLGWILLAFLLVGWALFIWQIRGAFFACAFAIPFSAWGVVRARQAWKRGAGRAGLLLFVAASMTAAPAAWSAVSQPIANRVIPAAKLRDFEHRKLESDACEAPEAFAPLRGLPTSTFLNSFILGPIVLQRTDHSVIAAPYHRNSAGLMATINAMRSDADAAKAIILRTSADYVLICAGLPEMSFYTRHPAGGALPEETLASRLVNGDVPDWLELAPLGDTPLRLYRIVR